MTGWATADLNGDEWMCRHKEIERRATESRGSAARGKATIAVCEQCVDYEG